MQAVYVYTQASFLVYAAFASHFRFHDAAAEAITFSSPSHYCHIDFLD